MRHLAFVSLLAVALTACAAPPTPQTVLASPEVAYKQLQDAVGSAACQADADCQTIAVGSKACGGPLAYMAYSTRGGQEAAIQRAAQALKDTQAADNQTSGRISDCMVVRDPGAQCVANRCQLRGDERGRLIR
ncbi:MAG: hypothetical protein LCH73_14330 [Proteobacteria bacterium]|nr:hypothetical protein [Pseudomonadota bacterium]